MASKRRGMGGRVSTNYYVRGHRYDDDPAVHIGKRYARGGGATGFIWAMDPRLLTSDGVGPRVISHCESCRCEGLIEDEYGTALSLDDMRAVIASCVEDTKSVGTYFS
jgi:hypothetical protein